MNSCSKNCNNNSTNSTANSNQFVQSCPTILACTGAAAPVTISNTTATAITSSNPLTVSTLNINNSCLDNPCTIIDLFSSISYTDTAAGTATVTFQLYKINLCSSTAPAIPVGSSWTYSSTLTAAGTDTESYAFTSCDCNNSMCNCKCCSDGNECYSYVLRAIAATVPTTGSVTITNPTLKAISTCGNICCNR